MLQHDRQLKLIATRIEKKIASELKSMLEHDRENYEKFFESFGLRLKFGMYENYGINKDKLKDLVLFRSSTGKMRTLKEYVQDMKEDQTCIYYAAGETPGAHCASAAEPKPCLTAATRCCTLRTMRTSSR